MTQPLTQPLTQPIKVMLVDDEYLIRELLKRSIDWQAFDMTIVAETSNALEVLDLVDLHGPDVIFMDICMPHIDGVSLSASVLEKHPRCQIVILSGHQNFEDARRCVNIGVRQFLSKPINGSEISSCLENLKRTIAEGQAPPEEKAAEGPFIATIKAYLMSHYQHAGLSLQEVADAHFIHPNHLSRRFSQEAGMPFKDYLQKLRIEAALRLIETTDLKNYEISKAIGMEDPNYFSVYFKKYMQMTIGEYRKRRASC